METDRPSGVDTSRWNGPVFWCILGLSALPYLLSLLGFDFSTRTSAVDPALFSDWPNPEFTDALYRALRGGLSHTIFEAIAFVVAAFTVVLAFLHFKMSGNAVVPVMGMALFCAGAMDAFHVLAADRLIEAVADNRNLIPFTWGLSRLFHSLILLAGVGVFFLPSVQRTINKRRPLGFVLGMSAIFAVAAYFIIHFCAVSRSLPRTMFPEAIIKRPYDILPLLIYIFSGAVVFPLFYRRQRNDFTFMLILSTIPSAATQLHMAFGSIALYDQHFNLAHILKIISYAVPFTGLCMDYTNTYASERSVSKHLAREIEKHKNSQQRLQQSESKLRTIVGTAVDGIITFDDSGVIQSFNQAAEEIFECRSGFAIGRSVASLFCPPFRDDLSRFLEDKGGGRRRPTQGGDGDPKGRGILPGLHRGQRVVRGRAMLVHRLRSGRQPAPSRGSHER